MRRVTGEQGVGNGRRTHRTAELFGGPLDGGTVGEPLDRYVQFLLIPKDRASRGPYPIYTYVYIPGLNRYSFCGWGAPALPY